MRRMYSENQLKDVVNKGIQSGEIEIPSGGTKLYKHTFTVANFINFVVYSNSNEPITSLTLLDAIIEGTESINYCIYGFGPATDINSKVDFVKKNYSESGSITSLELIVSNCSWDSSNSTLSYTYSSYNVVDIGEDTIVEI